MSSKMTIKRMVLVGYFALTGVLMAALGVSMVLAGGPVDGVLHLVVGGGFIALARVVSTGDV